MQENESLQTCAFIIRKYNLGDKNFFFKYFPHCDPSTLESAWMKGESKVHSRDVIKDALNLDSSLHQLAIEKFAYFDTNQERILAYLKSDFNVRALKLNKERIERRLRHLLAEFYIRREANPTSLKHFTNKKSRIYFPNKKTKTYFSRPIHYWLLFIGISLLFATPRIIDGFTRADILANKIYNRNLRKSNGAICRDGSKSASQGRGTCSHHGGVSYYFYKGEPTKSREECEIESKRRSWID